MVKMKTHHASAEGLRHIGIGKSRGYRAYRSHITGEKSPKRIRNPRRGSLVNKSDRRRTDHVVP